MPQHHNLIGAHGLTVEQLIARNRAIWGDARMEADASDANQDAQTPTDAPPLDAPVAELMAYLEESGLTPAQIKGRLEAGKTWERRAKASDVVDRADYDRVVAERDAAVNGTKPPLDDDAVAAALEQAREEGARNQREQDFQDTAAAMLRVALRAHGVTDDDALTEIVSATNLAHFKDDDDVLDDEKVATHAQRWAATARTQQWPDMGQENRGSGKPPTRSGKEIREKYLAR